MKGKRVKINRQLDIVREDELTEDFVDYELYDVRHDLFEKAHEDFRKSSVNTILELENHGFKVVPRHSEEKDWMKKYEFGDDSCGKLEIYYKEIRICLLHDYPLNMEIGNMVKDNFRYNATEKGIGNKEIDQTLKILDKILNHHYKQLTTISKHYIHIFLKELNQENMLYNPSVDKYKKPCYFNDEDIKLKVSCYFSDECYNILDEKDKDYPQFPVVFLCLGCISIRDLLKTECEVLKSYYKIYKIENKTYAVLKSIKTHELQAIFNIQTI